MSAPLAPCGTHGAYSRHYKRGEPIDEACRVARNEYVAALRQKNRDINRRSKRTAKIRARALTRLEHAHPDEFRRLLAEEYAKDPAS